MRITPEGYTVYPIIELDSGVQNEIIDGERDYEVGFAGWDDFIIENWKNTLETLGYENPNIMYRGFYCQGDGAYFDSHVDVRKWIAEHKLKKRFKYALSNHSLFSIELRSGHYSNDVRYEYYHEYDTNEELLELQVEAIVALIESEISDLCGNIYDDLESEYNYYTSNQYHIERIMNDCQEFTKEGVRYINNELEYDEEDDFMNTMYIPAYLMSVEREEGGWPEGLTKETKLWLIAFCRNVIQEDGPLPTWILVDRMREQPDKPDLGVSLDYIYACVHRACLEVASEQWVLTNP